MNHSPMELLAPAGQMASALAAFDAGADAIYAGLPKFNARERGENFTAEELAKTIAYAHGIGKKVYLTLNTLIKETELPELVTQLAAVEAMGPDAVIVQDLGVLRIIREYFPSLVIHASTQMGIHNSAGLAMAEAMGVKRVILERQVTLEELAEMRKKSNIELEIFIHGALCCSLSGSCLFSSWQGGASGNRGKCKQPCRRRFYAKDGNGFFFSTADLAALELIGDFKKLGIASLKIEGRLRQPDYVKAAVAAYRKVLDAPSIDHTLLGEARNLLSNTCGRRWSQGFFTEAAAAALIQHESLGAAGVLLGKVAQTVENGFFFTPAKRLHVGDRIRVQPASGEEGPALTVTRLFVANRPALKALPGELCFICCDKPVANDGLVFKIGTPLELNTARITNIKLRTRLDLELTLNASGLTVAILNVDHAELYHVPLALQPAANRPLTAEGLRALFAAGDSDVFELGQCHVKLEGDWFLPASELKNVRRGFWDMVKNTLNPELVHAPGERGMFDFYHAYQSMPLVTAAAIERETVAMRPRGATAGNPHAYRAVSVLDFNAETDEAILPDFCPESRLESLKKMIARAVAAKITRFRVTALFGLELLRGYENLTITSSYPLPVANSMAAAELARFGVQRVQAAVELDKAGLEALRDHAPLLLEIYRYGRPALLTTRAKLAAEGEIRDNRGNIFSIRPDGRRRLTRLYAKAVFSIPRLPGTADFYDLTEAWWGETETGDFNYTIGWL